MKKTAETTDASCGNVLCKLLYKKDGKNTRRTWIQFFREFLYKFHIVYANMANELFQTVIFLFFIVEIMPRT